MKAEKKQKAIAIMRDCPTSPRKMRLVADIIRGVEINKALGILRYSKKEASIRMEKLLKSAIANWEAKNEGERLEDTTLCVKEVSHFLPIFSCYLSDRGSCAWGRTHRVCVPPCSPSRRPG